MRILHLSTSAIGGAGVVARRIANMQRLEQHEVHVLTLNKSSNQFQEEIVERSYLNKLLAKVNTIISLIFTKKEWTQLTSMSVSARIISRVDKINPDVIHIHNWFNLLSQSDIQVLNRKYPLVFHIHDARLMSGGCHFTLACEFFNEGCIKCPASKVLRPVIRNSYLRTKELFENSFPYALIFPSQWLEYDFKSSSVYRNASTVCNALAPMLLDSEIEQKLHDKDGLVCVISDLSARVKGFDLFLESIEILQLQNFKKKVKVIGANATIHQREKMRDLNIEYLGQLYSKEVLSVIVESELIVVPSYSENSPTVILEAQLLHTCALVTSIPGNMELVEEGKTGYVCEPNPASMAAGVVRALADCQRNQISSNAYNKTRKELDQVNSRIYETYIEIIKKHREHG